MPDELPEEGLGEDIAFDKIAKMVHDLSANLGAADSLAHMDPSTPEVAAKLVGLNAAHNQNLLHPDLSPFAAHAEEQVLAWLLPHFGMRAGPLCLTRHAARLHGVEIDDRVAVSAHKWLYQPKDSAFVMFAAPDAQEKISIGGAYLAVPNVGVQGSRGAAGIALLGALLAWGRSGLAFRIEDSIALSEALADRLEHDPRVTMSQRPETSVLN